LETVSKSASVKDLQLSPEGNYELALTARKNSAYRSGCHKHIIFIDLLTRPGFSPEEPPQFPLPRQAVRKSRPALNSSAGVDVRTVQDWLGHESLATTQKYLEPSKETEKQLEAMKLPF